MYIHLGSSDLHPPRPPLSTGKQFVVFINILMNDTTFLLDESMESLKRIHDLQTEAEDDERWRALSREEQQTRTRQLQSDVSQCRSVRGEVWSDRIGRVGPGSCRVMSHSAGQSEVRSGQTGTAV